MANFAGYLLKATATNKEFPLKYMLYESYESTPNAREELKAYRDDNTRDLTRVTAQGHKSSFKFQTRPNLHLADKIEIQKFFTDAESDTNQRKISLQYWNDEDNTYKTAYFYRPDIKFPIRRVLADDIIYGSIELQFVEY